MFCLPVIAEHDYPALVKAAGPFFPRSYAGWVSLSDELEHMHEREGIARINIKSIEFVEYTKSAGREVDLQALLDFTAFNPWHDPDC